jgi:hypothetical protein
MAWMYVRRTGRRRASRNALLGRLAAEEAALARSTETLRQRVSALQRDLVALEAEQEALVPRMGRRRIDVFVSHMAFLWPPSVVSRLTTSTRWGLDRRHTPAYLLWSAAEGPPSCCAERSVFSCLARRLSVVPVVVDTLGMLLMAASVNHAAVVSRGARVEVVWPHAHQALELVPSRSPGVHGLKSRSARVDRPFGALSPPWVRFLATLCSSALRSGT